MKVIIIGGPTASGKSSKAIEIAKETGGAVISADSRQIYVGMDIGTAKVATRKDKPDWKTPIQYEGVDHYLIDIVYPNERYSLFDFKFQAEEIIKKLLEQNIQPIVAGGTGLYLDALIHNYEATEKSENLEIKNQLEEEYEKNGKQFMWEKLNKLSPDEAAKIPAGNYYMVLRALEVLLVTGKTKTKVAKKSKPNFEYELIILNPDRKELYKKIEQRIDEQIEQGLIEETKKLIELYGPDLHALTSLGYKEINSYLNGECTLDDALQLFKQKTRNYAKRQLTWFRRYL